MGTASSQNATIDPVRVAIHLFLIALVLVALPSVLAGTEPVMAWLVSAIVVMLVAAVVAGIIHLVKRREGNAQLVRHFVTAAWVAMALVVVGSYSGGTIKAVVPEASENQPAAALKPFSGKLDQEQPSTTAEPDWDHGVITPPDRTVTDKRPFSYEEATGKK